MSGPFTPAIQVAKAIIGRRLQEAAKNTMRPKSDDVCAEIARLASEHSCAKTWAVTITKDFVKQCETRQKTYRGKGLAVRREEALLEFLEHLFAQERTNLSEKQARSMGACLATVREHFINLGGQEAESDDSASGMDHIQARPPAGPYAKIAAEYRRRLNAAKHVGDCGAVRKLAMMLARFAADSGRWADASDYFLIAIESCGKQQLNDPIIEAELRNDLGWAQYNCRKWQDAVPSLERALKLWTELGEPDKRELSRTLDYLALNLRALADRSDTTEAEALYARAVRLLEKSSSMRAALKSPLAEAATLHRLARVQSASCRVLRLRQRARVADCATDNFERSMKIRGEAKLFYDYTKTVTALARHLLAQDPDHNDERIAELIAEALTVAKRMGYPDLEARALIAKGKHFVRTGAGKAEQDLCFRDAIERATDPALKAGAHQELASSWHRVGKLSMAKQSARQAVKWWKVAGDDARSESLQGWIDGKRRELVSVP